MKEHLFFKTFAFHFETLRTLWYAPANGSDFGEVLSILPLIKEGDYESWYQAWKTLAERTESSAKNCKDSVSSGRALLRANRYNCAAEFYLHPLDERKINAYEKSKEVFYEGLDQLKIFYELNSVSYKSGKLRTLFLPATHNPDARTLMICGGFDATLEELYYTAAQDALLRNYNVLIYEGPWAV